jgi:DNA-binding MarR family transcriptional regulator
MNALNPKNRFSPPGKITIALYRIAQAIQNIVRHRAAALGLSGLQLQSLLFLRYGRPAARTMGGLAQHLHVGYPAASEVVDALEKKRLARRVTDVQDRRITRLSLTTKGLAEAEALENLLDDVEDIIAALPPAEQAVLERSTQAIIRRLVERGVVHVADMCRYCQFFRPHAHPDQPDAPHHCAYIDAPLPESETYWECPDFKMKEEA